MKEVTGLPGYGCRWNLGPSGRDDLLAQEAGVGEKVAEITTQA